MKDQSIQALGDTPVVFPLVSAPAVLHEGRYRLYEKADGTLHLVYRPDGTTKDEHLEVPGAIIKLAKDAAEGNINPLDMMKMAGKMMGGAGGSIFG